MPEPATGHPEGWGISRRVERLGRLLLLAGTGFLLYRTHALTAWGGASEWVGFARHFGASFGRVPLPYGYPLLGAGAVAVGGPAYALAVNGVVLLVLVALLYAFARRLVPGSGAVAERLRALAGGLAVAGYLWRNGGWLADAVGPGGEPLGFALVLACCVMLLEFRRAPESSLGWLVGAGAALGLGWSTHEPTLALLAPAVVLGLASRRELDVARPALVFLGSLVLTALPMMVHAQLAAGHFFGTGAGGAAATSASVWLDTLRGATGRAGLVGLVLFAVALGRCVRRPSEPVVSLALPALVVFAAVDGRLPVLDLFFWPLAGVGAAVLVGAALGPLGPGWPVRGLAASAGLLAAALATFVAVQPGLEGRRAFQVQDALALRNQLGALLPDDAPVWADRRLAEILGALLDDDARIRSLSLDGLADGTIRDDTAAALRESPAVYFVFASPLVSRSLRRDFDTEAVASFRASSYRLDDALEPRFLVDRVSPWSQLQTLASLDPERSGPAVLRVDVGHLSGETRSFARLFFNDGLVDERPPDGSSYYRVDVADATRPATVRLASDAPVPAALGVGLQDLAQPLRLDFEAQAIGHRERFSGNFFARPWRSHPTLTGSGSIVVPTVAWQGAAFVVVAQLGVRRESARGGHRLTVGTPRRQFYRVTLTGQDDDSGPGSWSRVSFAFHEPLVRSPRTTVTFDYEPPETDAGRAGLAFRSLEVHRVELAPELRVDLGGYDEPFLISGLYPAEDLALPGLRGRRLAPRAELRMLLGVPSGSKRLRLRYAVAPGTEAATPRVAWNREVLTRLRRTREDAPEGALVTDHYALAAERILRPIYHLEIRSPDDAALVLESVAVEPTGD